MAIKIHKNADFKKMREAGALAAKTLDYIAEHVVPGVTTERLDDLCHEFITSQGAIPAPLNYKGFLKSICTSINHVVCHGIPSDKKLKNGDFINIDVTVIVDGWHGDTSRMYYVGDVGVKQKRLVQVTYEAMMIGIEMVKPGVQLGDIGSAIQKHAEKHKYSVVRNYTGHGIGQVFHDEPSVLHYGRPGTGIVLEEGMFFTTEPIVNAGKYDTILSKFDGCTVTIRDKSLSAQFEHTVGVTKDGVEIFTTSPKKLLCPHMSLENKTEEQPHHVGHRKRLKNKFLQTNPTGFSVYELLELVLFQSVPRRDVKPLAKDLLSKFENFNQLINADREKVLAVSGASESIYLQFRVIKEMLNRVFAERVENKNVISSWSPLLEYLKFNMGCLKIEQFRVLFINKKNILIADEIKCVISTAVDITPCKNTDTT